MLCFFISHFKNVRKGSTLMYTVVIVDDEPWALQGLAEIID